MSRKKWNVSKVDKAKALSISEKYNIDEFTSLLLDTRGFDTDEKIRDFIENDFSLCDPYLLPDMKKAVDKINEAIFDFKKMAVFGDYDADGVTATALLYSYLEAQGADVIYYIPDRIKEGYGLAEDSVRKLHELGIKLIITVDSGISSISEAELIYSLGMELVVTDHHIPGEKLPRAEAVVDPHRTDANLQFHEWAGVGVAFKLVCALEDNADLILEQYSDLVAIGTVADIVPLTNENRKLVKYGLRRINRRERLGLEELLNISGLSNRTITSQSIAFGIAPRINAAGRMANASLALQLLLSDDPLCAKDLAEIISKDNILRHETENKIMEDAIEYIDENPQKVYDPVLIVEGIDWHEGVIGIVASKLVEKFLKPCIAISITDEVCRGSCRSVNGFSMHEALKECEDLLVGFGGHVMAAGFSIKKENIDSFIKRINEYALKMPFAYPELHIDCKLNPSLINVDLLSSIGALAPFGASNPAPIFMLSDLVLEDTMFMGDNKQHIKFIFHQYGNVEQKTTVIKFNSRITDYSFRKNDRVDIVVSLEQNFYMGREQVSLFLKDSRPHGTSDEDMVKSKEVFMKLKRNDILNNRSVEYLNVTRDQCLAIYKFIKSRDAVKNEPEYILSKIDDPGLNQAKIMVAVDSLVELKVLEINNGFLSASKTEEKVSLNDGTLFKRISANINMKGGALNG